MEKEANPFRSVVHIITFCVIAFKGWRSFFASSEKKILIHPNQIHKVKRFVKPSKNTKLMNVHQQAMEIYFPEEITMDIFSRLPLQTLFRLKCASKFCNTLISKQHFMTMHLIHSKNNQNTHKLLISRRCPNEGSMIYYWSSLSLVRRGDDVQKLGYPTNRKPCGYVILCSCDGLSLLWSRDAHLLWNPFTRESIVLPNPEFPPASSCMYGMGYDSTIDDYKIVRINKGNFSSKIVSQMLSLKIGSWRKIDNHPRGVCNRLFGKDSLAFAHEAFHWIGMDSSSNYLVVSFNLSNEVYGEISLPEEFSSISNPRYLHCGVSVLGGLLCAYYTCRNREAGTFKSWVMKDYGVKESWTKLFTMQETDLYITIPKYRFADGEVLFYFEEHMYFGFRTTKGPYGRWHRSSSLIQGFVLTESLISPKLIT